MVAHLGDAARGDGTEDYGCLILEGGRLGSLPEGVGGTASSEAIATAASRGACCPLSLRGEQTRGHAQCSLTACYAEEPRLILAQMPAHPPPAPLPSLAPTTRSAVSYTVPFCEQAQPSLLAWHGSVLGACWT